MLNSYALGQIDIKFREVLTTPHMALGDGISDALYQSLWDRIRSGEGMNLWSKAGSRPSAEEETAIYSTTLRCKPLSTS